MSNLPKKFELINTVYYLPIPIGENFSAILAKASKNSIHYI